MSETGAGTMLATEWLHESGAQIPVLDMALINDTKFDLHFYSDFHC